MRERGIFGRAVPVDFTRWYKNGGAGGDGIFFGPGCQDALARGDVNDLLVGMGVKVEPGARAESDQQDPETPRIFGIDERFTMDRSLEDDFVLRFDGGDVFSVDDAHVPPLMNA